MATSGVTNAMSNEASAARSAFFSRLGSIPKPLRTVVQDSYQRRLERACGRPLLGEYTAPLLGDLLAIGNRDLVARFQQPILNIYLASLMTDDLLDREEGEQIPLVSAAASLLVQRGISDLFRFLPASPTAQLLDHYFLAAADAALVEVATRRNRVHLYTDDDVDALGNKGGLLVLAAELMMLGERREFDATTREVINDLLVAVQLLDDVTDWREDWETGHFTHLLTLTSSGWGDLGKGKFAGMPPAGAFRAMVETKALEHVLIVAQERLRSVAHRGGVKQSTVAGQLIFATISELSPLIIQVATIRTALGIVSPEEDQKQLKHIEDRLQVVAQES